MGKPANAEAQSLAKGLTKHRNTWIAKLTVPADVREIIGRNSFVRSTECHDLRQAHTVAAPWLAGWRAEIEAARERKENTQNDTVARLAHTFATKHAGEMTTDKAAFLDEVLSFVFESYGRLSPEAHIAAVKQAGSSAKAMIQIKGASTTFDMITGNAPVPVMATPFLAHIEAWKAAKPLATSLGMERAERHLNEFANRFPGVTLEQITGGFLQQWIDKLESDGKLGFESIRKKRNDLANYWHWMEKRDLVSRHTKPLNGLEIKDGRINGQDNGKQAFEPAEAVKLWTGTQSPDLSDAIKLAAYMGLRIESVASLNTAKKPTKDGTYAYVTEYKGVRIIEVMEKKRFRLVPIHATVESIIDRRIASAKDGWLFPAFTANRHEDRSAKLDDRFRSLKRSQGYGDKHSFHSLRHTWTRIVSKADVQDRVIKFVMGHASIVNDQTFGVGHSRYNEWPIVEMKAAMDMVAYPAP